MSSGWKAFLAVLLGGAAGAAGVILVRKLGSGGRYGDADDEPDSEFPEHRPGRGFELALLHRLIDKHGDDRVLDNPHHVANDGEVMKPDAVVLDGRGRVREIREAKDVRELREEHLLQAFRYDDEFRPQKGTTVDVPDRTHVSREMRQTADELGLKIRRWKKFG